MGNAVPGRQYKVALDGGRPDDLAVEPALDMSDQGIAFVAAAMRTNPQPAPNDAHAR